jgi:hypothetical protein
VLSAIVLQQDTYYDQHLVVCTLERSRQVTQPVPSEPHPWEPEEALSPTSQPWGQATPLSQPDPVAFSHVDPMLLAEGGVTVPFMDPISQPLYPDVPSDPPPPPLAPSESGYYPLLMPTHPLQNNGRGGWAATGIGLAVGIIVGMLLIGLLAFIAVQSGVFAHPASAAVTTIITTGGGQNATPTQTGLGITGTATPTVVVTTTPGVYATATPQPGILPTPVKTVHPGPTATPIPGVTATPQPTATPTSIPPTATPLPPLQVNVTLNGRDHQPLMLFVQTMPSAPYASLSISVVDCDGVTDPNAPTSGTTDGVGDYQTQWMPRRPNGCNMATATVTATLGSQSGTGTGTGTV